MASNEMKATEIVAWAALNDQLELIENILKDAQDSIQYCSSHFQKSADQVGFTNDELTQSIDECEIYINDALEELEQFKYHFNSEKPYFLTKSGDKV